MRYTRYDFKHKKSSSIPFLICLIIVLTLSFIIGSFIFKTFIKVIGTPGGQKNTSSTYDKKENMNEKIFVLQCSADSKKENADGVLKNLVSIGNPFEVKDKGYYKVIYAICNEKDYSTYEKIINDNKVVSNRFTIAFDKKDSDDDELYNIVSGYLEIINKLRDKDVKSVQTASLKKWCSNLSDSSKDYKNYAVSNEIKNHIKSIPGEINKDNVSEQEVFIYNELSKIKR
ncbi:hypothetical protein [Clostridium felsineum]|uniref:Uncharacterized protein n=1 Tax=Clostridium felsineum TaxID=36839 RepID=A0A1S8MB58_9CLOT|nr:hypothetical protein [Clostridium felsineum]MCR3758245.1 hypothetical protein [Clostridium felsineum]URZ01199.1 hypothetical protein CLAUR_011870 [Clostridium felsineum]URZ06045.1 hypothetical protein CLROS_013780 [Clostridium felsineum]URZ11082.1 hypothetical protein CROST_017990 [Clostridium felsineum]